MEENMIWRHGLHSADKLWLSRWELIKLFCGFPVRKNLTPIEVFAGDPSDKDK
jgi:hypothetical protein